MKKFLLPLALIQVLGVLVLFLWAYEEYLNEDYLVKQTVEANRKYQLPTYLKVHTKLPSYLTNSK